MIRFIKKAARLVYCTIRSHRLLHKYVTEHTEKERVLVMVHSLYGGGAERVACAVASGLTRKYHVLLLYMQDKGRMYPLGEEVRTVQVPPCIGWNRVKRRTAFFKRLRKKVRPKAVISLMFGMNRYNALTAGTGLTICCERNDPSRREPEHMEEIGNYYETADLVVFQSAAVRDQFSDKVRQHSRILPNPVSVTCTRSEQTAHRIINIGRLTAQKNQAMLIRAFAAFHRAHPDYTLAFYGEGELRDQLEELAVSLGLGEAVAFCGQTDRIHEAVADAEMFVLSSDYEGLSNALLECMMMGMPCISTACSGSVDVIEDGVNGLLVPVGQEEALRQAMCRLAEEPAFREQLGRAARESSRRYDREAVIEQWIELIENGEGDSGRWTEQSVK